MNNDENFFELVKILDDKKIDYCKTTNSFLIEKGVVINNSFVIKVKGNTFLYGNANGNTSYETDDFSKVKKWFDGIVSKLSKQREELEKLKRKEEQKKVLLKNLVGEGKQIEQIRRKIEKEFPHYFIEGNKYPAVVRTSNKKRNTLLIDYKNKVYSITKRDMNGFILGRIYRTTNFDSFLKNVYNYVFIDNLEYTSNQEAKVTAVSKVSKADKEYIFRKAEEGDKSILKLPIEALKIKNNEGETPVHLLAWKGVTEILKLPKELLKIKDKYGWTPVHWLAEDGVKEVLKLPKELLTIKNNDGKTPVHYLAWKGVREVLKLPKDLLSIKNNDGDTPEDILNNN